ncbi:ATG7 [Mytilus edulis]|uniref:ATG7 n=1 Tax=Mytilus edulis TaxID=6550 RepID=A0A8S3SFB6_MYTED|nr:ATG7 [Mytilus edulis]
MWLHIFIGQSGCRTDNHPGKGDPAGLPCRLNVEYSAFDKVPQVPSRCFRSHGVLRNMNTIDKFKECDHKELLENVGKKVWEDIVSNKIEEDPSLLSRFLLLTFADLKKYIYYYWFAFPCLCMPEDVTMVTDPVKLTDRLNSQQVSLGQLFFNCLKSTVSIWEYTVCCLPLTI